MYDVIIIGAGPAGISAAIYAVSRGCKTLVLEQTKVGGLIGNVSTVTHYCGIIENETGATIASRMEKQALDAVSFYLCCIVCIHFPCFFYYSIKLLCCHIMFVKHM